MAAETKTKKDEVVDRFETYEDYLDTFITEDDMIFLGEEEIARIVVELGYREDTNLPTKLVAGGHQILTCFITDLPPLSPGRSSSRRRLSWPLLGTSAGSRR